MYLPNEPVSAAIAANRLYAMQNRQPNLIAPPRRNLAVVTCMDVRIDPLRALGLELGDAHIIRNAGAAVTEDVLRSLIISHHKLNTKHVMIIGHTDCGLATFDDASFRQHLHEKSGERADDISAFHTFDDVERHVQKQVQRVLDHPWLPDDVTVDGFVFDVHHGWLTSVDETSLKMAGVGADV